MERALDPELLRLALGEHAALPAPEDLAAMLAGLEVALLAGGGEPPEPLLATAWHLHAIASSPAAPERYGAARQRAAFQVAGHALDLALQGGALEGGRRLEYTFAAQVAYLRGELAPNAIALYRRGFPSGLEGLSLTRDLDGFALACGVALLATDYPAVMRLTAGLREEAAGLAAVSGLDDVSGTMFGAASRTAAGCRALMRFLAHGALDFLGRARALFREAVDGPASRGDYTSRWAAAHLLRLSDDLERASVWTALPPEVPPGVRRAFAAAAPRVMTLWPPQLEFFGGTDLDGRHPLSAESRRLYMSMPTSAGKTLLAQLLVATHVATRATDVCYVAPTRSLCREVHTALNRRLRLLTPQRVTVNLPEFALPVDLGGSRVEVMTPERLAYLLRADASAVLARFGMFVFDEVHNVSARQRGWTLESDLAYLHHATRGTDHRMVLMSAAVGNDNHFVQWLGAAGEPPVARRSTWRGPRRLHTLWTVSTDFQTVLERTPAQGNALPRVAHPELGNLHVRVSSSGKVEHLQFTEPVGRAVYRVRREGGRAKDGASTRFYESLLPLVEHLGSLGPVLVLEASKEAAVRMATALARTRAPLPPVERQGLVDLARATLGDAHPLTWVLERGVGYHHGSLPRELREAVEEAVADGHLPLLVSTTTMTEGLNLPVRSVVVASQGDHGDGDPGIITGSRLINAIGRAGRAARETEGVVVLARPGRYDAQDFARLDPAAADLAAVSRLATEKALEELADFEGRRDAAEDALLETTTGAVSDFLGFVWFVASQLEGLDGPAALERLEATLAHTLAWAQLAPENRERWRAVAGDALGYYAALDPARRRRWATTGTSLKSAATLDRVAERAAAAVRERGAPRDPFEAVRLLLGEDFEEVLALPEAPALQVKTRRRAGRTVAVPHLAVLRDWMAGEELRALAERHFAEVEDLGHRFEQLAEYLNDLFETFLPWVVAKVVGWVNEALAADGGLLPPQLPEELAAYVRWGVNDPTVLELVAQGVRSKRLAFAVARAWLAEDRDVGPREWVASLGVARWQAAFDATGAELRNLLEFSRSPAGVGARLLGGETVELAFVADGPDLEAAVVELRAGGAADVLPVGVWAGGHFLGVLPAEHDADVRAMLNSSLAAVATVSVRDNAARLQLRFVEPEGD